VFGKVFGFLADRLLDRDRDRPQVAISLKQREARAEPEAGTPGELRVTWTLELRLSNDSPAAAADLKFFWPTEEPLFHAALPYHLGTFEEKALTIRLQKTLTPEQVGGRTGERLFELLPPELKEPSLVLTYRDVQGDYYHTRYRSRGGQESCEFLAKPPERTSP
jgi:hypothetical protein